MLGPGFKDRSFRVVLRECSRVREEALQESRERVAGLLAIGMVMAVPLVGMISTSDFALVDESEAAEPSSGSAGFEPPAFNVHAVLDRVQHNDLRPSDIRSLQTELKRRGFDPGPVDGVAGNRTLAALNAYRESRDLSPVLAVSREAISVLQSQ